MKNIFKIEIDNSRIFGLDLLRAIAILMVVIEHGGNLLPANLRAINYLFVLDGVSIFFVLSGFLIGGILIKCIEKEGYNFKMLKKFWVRRWFRTLPNYFLILIIICLLHYFFTDGFSFKNIASYFIFSQNICMPHPSWFFPEAWSLCVEEWFYLIIPILIGLVTVTFKSNLKNQFFFLSIFIIFCITLFRYYRFVNIPIINLEEWDLNFRKQVITRLDSLMYGVLAANISFYFAAFWNKYKIQMLFIGIALFVIAKYIMPHYFLFNNIYNTVFSFSIISLATALLLPFLSQFKLEANWFTNTIVRISLISYSIYLINLTIVQLWIINKIPFDSFIHNQQSILVLKYGLFWFLVLIFSILLYKYFEIPITKLRDRKGIVKQL
jgi:peptidoglycan/LPS O-acetylase OafA/YrhL